jgi:hypothetical protein
LKGDGLKRRCSLGKRSNQGEDGSRDDLALEKRWSWWEHVTRWQSPCFVLCKLLTKPNKGEGSHSGLSHKGPQPWISKCDVIASYLIHCSYLMFAIYDILMLVLDHHGLQRITPKTDGSFHSNFGR